MRKTSLLPLLLVLPVGALLAVATAQDTKTTTDPAPATWPPRPADIVCLNEVDMKLTKRHTPVYRVPDDRWLILTAFDVHGPAGTNLYEIVGDEKPVLKLPGAFVGLDRSMQFDTPRPFRAATVGIPFQPGAHVALQDPKASELTWYLLGYLVPASPNR